MPLHIENEFEFCKSISKTYEFATDDRMIYITVTTQELPTFLKSEKETKHDGKEISECLKYLGDCFLWNGFEEAIFEHDITKNKSESE